MRTENKKFLGMQTSSVVHFSNRDLELLGEFGDLPLPSESEGIEYTERGLSISAGYFQPFHKSIQNALVRQYTNIITNLPKEYDGS